MKTTLQTASEIATSLLPIILKNFNFNTPTAFYIKTDGTGVYSAEESAPRNWNEDEDKVSVPTLDQAAEHCAKMLDCLPHVFFSGIDEDPCMTMKRALNAHRAQFDPTPRELMTGMDGAKEMQESGLPELLRETGFNLPCVWCLNLNTNTRINGVVPTDHNERKTRLSLPDLDTVLAWMRHLGLVPEVLTGGRAAVIAGIARQLAAYIADRRDITINENVADLCMIADAAALLAKMAAKTGQSLENVANACVGYAQFKQREEAAQTVSE